MRLFDSIFRSMFESQAGRIKYTSGGWAFNPSKGLLEKTFKVNPNLRNLKSRNDADGKMMTLVSQRSVFCPNPDIGQDKYPRHQEFKRYSIPSTICGKCQFHKKADRRGRYRFPRCMWASSQNPAKDAVSETVKLFEKAVEETNKIIGGIANGT